MKKGSVAGTVCDPTIEFAELEIDGQKYSLAYDFNAIAEAESLAECNLLQGVAGILLNTMTASQMRGLLYAALRKAHPKITIAAAGSMIRIDTMPDIQMALLRCYNASLPEEKKLILTESGEGGSAAPENS